MTTTFQDTVTGALGGTREAVATVLVIAAESAARRGDTIRAEEYFGRAIRLDPTSVPDPGRFAVHTDDCACGECRRVDQDDLDRHADYRAGVI